MALYAGPVWRSGQSRVETLRVERGRIVATYRGERPGARPAVILDGLHNYHTHVGDAILHGRALPRSLERLVAPGTGLKHRTLSATPRHRLVHATRRALQAYWDHGQRSALDFREQGIEGLAWVRAAADEAGPRTPRLRLLGRATGRAPHADEWHQVAAAADGLGVSSLRDVGSDAYAAAAREARRARKPLATHASEGVREPMEMLLAERPDLLVHACRATKRDLALIADAGIPIALCPTSNRFFASRALVEAVWKAGIPFGFGTDNAMLGSFDLLDEARLARRLAPTVPDGVLLEALTRPPEKVINRLRPVLGPVLGPRRVAILPRRGDRVQWRAPTVWATS